MCRLSCRAVSARVSHVRLRNVTRPSISHMRRHAMHAAEAESAVTSEMLELAQALADDAAGVTKPLFRAKLKTDIKEDRTPVTEADREAERLMREMVHAKYPSHSVFGEEYGYDPGFGGAVHSLAMHRGAPFPQPTDYCSCISIPICPSILGVSLVISKRCLISCTPRNTVDPGSSACNSTRRMASQNCYM